jgi:signal transduction protein with GAF and PtsI domain
LKRYEAERAKKVLESTLDEARDRYAVGVGVGMLVLEERNRKLEKRGEKLPEDTLTERQAVARAALALMPDFDKLVQEAGLESG